MTSTNGRAPKRPVLCDRCGSVISEPAAAVVAGRFDADDQLVELGVYHRHCSLVGRIALGRCVDMPAAAFNARVDDLRRLARSHDGASVTRALRKVRSMNFERGATT
jgi:hypothetical protein